MEVDKHQLDVLQAGLQKDHEGIGLRRIRRIRNYFTDFLAEFIEVDVGVWAKGNLIRHLIGLPDVKVPDRGELRDFKLLRSKEFIFAALYVENVIFHEISESREGLLVEGVRSVSLDYVQQDRPVELHDLALELLWVEDVLLRLQVFRFLLDKLAQYFPFGVERVFAEERLDLFVGEVAFE